MFEQYQIKKFYINVLPPFFRLIKIEAIIRREKLDDVKSSLAKVGLLGMTVYEVKGRGRQKGFTINFRGRQFSVDLLPKLKMEIIVKDADLEKAIGIIRERAFTGEIGDGKIFIYPIMDAIRIRTGERGEEAI